jgi:hypothetical protein
MLVIVKNYYKFLKVSNMKKLNQKFSEQEIEYLSRLKGINGKELVELLRNLGITMNRYASMIQPPLASASGINYYRAHKKLPFRLISPLIEQYPMQFLINLLDNKLVVSTIKEIKNEEGK